MVQMASKQQKRDITSFFKPYSPSIPSKRPSPSLEDDEVQYIMTKPKQTDLRTPSSATRFKDATSPPSRSPIGLGSGGSVKIPIRTPKTRPCQEPVTSFSSRLFASYKDSPIQKQRDDVKSLQSPPQPLSFADLPSSTQSIVKEGKVVAVRGSDEEDSDSLSSLDDILGRRKSETATSSSSPPELDADEREAERMRTIFRFTNGRSQPLVGKDKLRELNSKEREAKVDIGSLMVDHFDDQEIEGNISKAKQGYERVGKEEENFGGEGDVDRNLLASVVAGPLEAQDDISRLLNAVERTEALNFERSWSFFGSGGLESPSAKPIQIEKLSGWWRESLEDNELRNRTFLSGFVGEAWSSGRFPDELIQWILDSIVREPQNELRRSYVYAFKHLKPECVATYFRPSTVERLFLQIGASQQSVSCADLIEPTTHVPRTSEQPDYRYLLSVIEMLMAVAPHLEISTHEKLLAILGRLALDARIMGDGRVSVAVEDGVSELIELSAMKDNHATAKSFVADFGTHLTDPTLQAQLLKHIPCTSSLAAYIRIQLAHRFLLGTDSDSKADVDSLSVNITKLTRYLDSGPFDITIKSPSKRPDYTNMIARTYLLDVAIAGGGRPTSFDSRAEEVSFNRKVDKLADRTKAIFASIADTGASHMRRTEAKEALQALYYRLLYAVRTEPRPKKNVFGGRDGEEYRAEERSQGFMTKFLARKKDKGSSQGPGRELISDKSSQASKSESEELIRRQLQLDV